MWTRAVLVFIVVLNGTALITGCDRQPARMAWVSIEKPPIRLIYVNQQELIDSETVHHLLQHIEKQPYKEYAFNPTIGIKAETSLHQSDTESDTDSTTVNKGN